MDHGSIGLLLRRESWLKGNVPVCQIPAASCKVSVKSRGYCGWASSATTKTVAGLEIRTDQITAAFFCKCLQVLPGCSLGICLFIS